MQVAIADTKQRVQELSQLLLAWSPREGVNSTPLPGVQAIRVSKPGDEMTHTVHQPAVCVIAQGAKRVMLQAQAFEYDPSRVLVFTVDLPVSAQVTHASLAEPYLCFRLDIDPLQVADVVVQARMPRPQSQKTQCGLFLTSATDELLDAVLRLMRLADRPDEVAPLAPLFVREILFRLLQSPEGQRLASVASGDSHASRIARAIEWMKVHRLEPLRVDEVARQVHMSPSSFHLRFRELTSMSPLQYHKQLRLQEARRLMLAEGTDAATASHRVGYQSASQFSREYRRQFGSSPARDIQQVLSLVRGEATG